VASEADLILSGARVSTSIAAARWAQAVAVRSGRIVAVGSSDEVDKVRGPTTEVLRLDGRMVVPGFQDSHVHPDHGGLARTQCDLHDVSGREAYEETIRAYAESHPEAEWIVGGGWSLDDFPRGTPHRSVLDEIVPDRPVFLANRDVHGAWVNSRALELARIGRGTPDPPDGRIEREEDGTPFGTLHEGAMGLVERLIPPNTALELDQALLEGQRYLHSLGVTGWQDAIVTPETLAAYRRLADRGHLTARVVGSLWWDRDRGEEQIADLVELRGEGAAGRFRPTAVKIMQDGIIENFTAAVLDPYLDALGGSTANRGISFIEAELLKRSVVRLDALGFQVHVHAIGERAVREALDAFQAAREANGPRDSRHHIAHIQVIHPEDLPRFAELGVVANGQPLWACLDGQMRNLTIPFLGAERAGWQYPFRSLLASGARLAFGSDWPVSTPNPLEEIEVAVNRVPPERRDLDVFIPEERLDLAQALDAFTIGSAFVNHLDHQTGSIEVGKVADMAVIDRDLFADSAGPIGEARVVMTLVEGEPVYSDLDRTAEVGRWGPKL
jgi:predicted amidohydrolase YtcJ